MKLIFKQQPYQTDATMAVVRCFEGQSKGFRNEVIGRTGLFVEEIFSNKKLEITESDIPKNVLKVIDKSIPYQILYRFVYEDNEAYGITLKEHTSVENYYFSDWNADISFDFTGIDLEKVYQKLVKAFVRDEAQHKGSFSEIINLDRKIKTLETEIAALESKISKKKQFNRKVEINKVLLEKKAMLAEINKGLK